MFGFRVSRIQGMNVYNLAHNIQHFQIALMNNIKILFLKLCKYSHHELYNIVGIVLN